MKSKPEMLGAQKRNVTSPGGFVLPRRKSTQTHFRDAQSVRQAATRLLEARGEVNTPNLWEAPALKHTRP